MASETEYESVLLVKAEVFVYKIPPRTTNRGYRWGRREKVKSREAEGQGHYHYGINILEANKIYARLPLKICGLTNKNTVHILNYSTKYFLTYAI